MAVELPRRTRNISSPAAVALTTPYTTELALRLVEAAQPNPLPPLAMRALQALPGVTALTLIGFLLSGFAFFPVELAVLLLVFDAYWLWKSWTIVFHAVKGYRMIEQTRKRDWSAFSRPTP